MHELALFAGAGGGSVENFNSIVQDELLDETKTRKHTMKSGLYKNIHAKRKRIKAGSGERMRKPGAKGAPTAKAFKDSAKTAKKKRKG